MSADISYGTVRYGERNWIIECETFVRSRLKRVFPRAPQEAATRIRIAANPENSRELEWFLTRFPMKVAEPERLAKLAEAHRVSERRYADLMQGHVPPLEVKLAEPARDYQAFAAQVLEVKGGLLLADDLGLGKTFSGIIPMAQPGNLPAVVVCPPHLQSHWRKQLKRFAPALTSHILKKGTPYDLTPKTRKKKGQAQIELIPESAMPDVIITSYHKLRGWAETLAGKICYMALDEVQQLRSPHTDIYKAAKFLADTVPKKMGLSATPIYNYGHEFHHVISVLTDGLGEYGEFIREWCTAEGSGKARLSDPTEFGAYLRREGLMLRRTRKDVGRELPELTKIVHEVESDEAALNALKSNAVALAQIVLGHNEAYRGQKMNAAGEFDALMRQATGIAKAPYVAEFVKLLLESGEPIVLFGWHRNVYDIWLEALKDYNPVLYTGSESTNQKDASLEAFLSGKARVLIMSLRSGAGVDGLQGFCSNVVFGELDWSPGVHEQCIGRVHRDGQGEKCNAYFLVSETGADPIMSEVLGVKREQIEAVRNPDAALVERIDTGENNLRRLAREFLEKRGVALPESNVAQINVAQINGKEVKV